MAHMSEIYFMGGREDGHSFFRQRLFSPRFIGWSVQGWNWNTLIRLIPVLRFRVCPSVWSELHTIVQRSLHFYYENFVYIHSRFFFTSEDRVG
uniref:Uncharacterized protein n=1 Tax=Solanum lycopersicum TaxID=4081 RepID=A0A3Q7EA97_SOLLC